MLSQYFGFREDPFGVTPDQRFLYESPTHSEALASLKYGILSSRGFVTLIAPPGMGKTTILMRFLRDISRSARTAFLFDVDPNCPPRDIVSYVLRDLGVKPGNDSAEMHEQLKAEVTWEAKSGRSIIVVVDEAQNLSETSLEVVRTLTNFETPHSKLVQVVLAGQPQLAEKLSRPSLEQLRQRITTFCKIEPLTIEQRVTYIEHRVRFVGYSGPPLFSSEALDRIVEASEGTPRVINNLCWNALSLCCALKRKQVDGRMVAEALADLTLITRPAEGALVLTSQSVVRNAGPGLIDSSARAALTPARVSEKAGFPWAWRAAAAGLLVLITLNLFGLLHLWRRSTSASPVSEPSVRAASSAPPQLMQQVVAPQPEKTPISIVVKRNESLRDLSLRYLGEFNRSRIQQIMKLNPSLTDPNRILEGQTILLPPRD